MAWEGMLDLGVGNVFFGLHRWEVTVSIFSMWSFLLFLWRESLMQWRGGEAVRATLHPVPPRR